MKGSIPEEKCCYRCGRQYRKSTERTGIRIICVLLDNTFSCNTQLLIKNEQTPSILCEKKVLKLKYVLVLDFY